MFDVLRLVYVFYVLCVQASVATQLERIGLQNAERRDSLERRQSLERRETPPSQSRAGYAVRAEAGGGTMLDFSGAPSPGAESLTPRMASPNASLMHPSGWSPQA